MLLVIKFATLGFGGLVFAILGFLEEETDEEVSRNKSFLKRSVEKIREKRYSEISQAFSIWLLSFHRVISSSLKNLRLAFRKQKKIKKIAISILLSLLFIEIDLVAKAIINRTFARLNIVRYF